VKHSLPYAEQQTLTLNHTFKNANARSLDKLTAKGQDPSKISNLLLKQQTQPYSNVYQNASQWNQQPIPPQKFRQAVVDTTAITFDKMIREQRSKSVVKFTRDGREQTNQRRQVPKTTYKTLQIWQQGKEGQRPITQGISRF
jgi:hypothetical protein